MYDAQLSLWTISGGMAAGKKANEAKPLPESWARNRRSRPGDRNSGRTPALLGLTAGNVLR
jgi:hypothetical protein